MGLKWKNSNWLSHSLIIRSKATEYASDHLNLIQYLLIWMSSSMSQFLFYPKSDLTFFIFYSIFMSRLRFLYRQNTLKWAILRYRIIPGNICEGYLLQCFIKKYAFTSEKYYVLNPVVLYTTKICHVKECRYIWFHSYEMVEIHESLTQSRFVVFSNYKQERIKLHWIWKG